MMSHYILNIKDFVCRLTLKLSLWLLCIYVATAPYVYIAIMFVLLHVTYIITKPLTDGYTLDCKFNFVV